jgi:hypothetical protein
VSWSDVEMRLMRFPLRGMGGKLEASSTKNRRMPPEQQ